jgi:hypothetical protein
MGTHHESQTTFNSLSEIFTYWYNALLTQWLYTHNEKIQQTFHECYITEHPEWKNVLDTTISQEFEDILPTIIILGQSTKVTLEALDTVFNKVFNVQEINNLKDNLISITPKTYNTVPNINIRYDVNSSSKKLNSLSIIMTMNKVTISIVNSYMNDRNSYVLSFSYKDNLNIVISKTYIEDIWRLEALNGKTPLPFCIKFDIAYAEDLWEIMPIETSMQ